MSVSSQQLSRMDKARLLAAGSNWPRIASRPARQLVRAAFHCCGSLEIERRYPDSLPLEVLSMDPRAKRHQLRIQLLLRRSDLAARLPAGLNLLPDIYAEYSPFWNVATRTFRPRNYRQLARHLVENLEWYLEPTERPLPPYDWLFGAMQIGVFAIYFLVYFFADQPIFGLLAGLFISVGIVRAINQHLVKRRSRKSAHLLDVRYRRWINAAELYYYLADAYSDVEEQDEHVP